MPGEPITTVRSDVLHRAAGGAQIFVPAGSPVSCRGGQISECHSMLFVEQKCCAAGRRIVSCALDKLPQTEEAAEAGKPQIHQCFLRGEKRSVLLLGSITESAWMLNIYLNNVFESM